MLCPAGLQVRQLCKLSAGIFRGANVSSRSHSPALVLPVERDFAPKIPKKFHNRDVIPKIHLFMFGLWHAHFGFVASISSGQSKYPSHIITPSPHHIANTWAAAGVDPSLTSSSSISQVPRKYPHMNQSSIFLGHLPVVISYSERSLS